MKSLPVAFIPTKDLIHSTGRRCLNGNVISAVSLYKEVGDLVNWKWLKWDTHNLIYRKICRLRSLKVENVASGHYEIFKAYEIFGIKCL